MTILVERSMFNRAKKAFSINLDRHKSPQRTTLKASNDDNNCLEDDGGDFRIISAPGLARKAHEIALSKEASSPKKLSSPRSPKKRCLKKNVVSIEEEEVDILIFLRKSQWQEFRQELSRLEQSNDPEGTRKVLTTRNKLEETPLHIAAWKAPLRLTLYMLNIIPLAERSDCLLLKDRDGNTPLHLACANVDVETVDFAVLKKILLTVPDVLNTPNRYGDTPLHLLVASDAFSKAKDDFVIEAAAEETISALLTMIGAKKAATRQNGKGLTLLHIAVASHSYERILIQLLKLAPAAATVADKRGMLPLHYAAASATTSWFAVKALITAHPDSITAQTLDGDTPLHLLMMNATKRFTEDKNVDRNTIKIAELLLGQCEHVTPSNHSSSKISTGIGSPKKSRRGSVGRKNSDEPKTPKRSAGGCRRNSMGDVMEKGGKAKIRISQESSPLTIQNNEGLSPLHVCALFDTPSQLTRVLMDSPECDAASLCKVFSGSTALHLLCASDHVAENIANIRVFASCVAACAATDNNDHTPLVVASLNPKSSPEVIKELCRAYPPALTTPSKSGKLPLHYLIQTGPKARSSIVKALLKAAPETATSTWNGHTPLHEACKHGASASVMLALLQKYPEARDIKNAEGFTPLDIARANNHENDYMLAYEGCHFSQ